MTTPFLTTPQSGFGGRGYVNPFDPGEKLPGVTTVLNAIAQPGIVQWSCDNTAAYAVANIDALLNRTEEQGYAYLRWYHKRQPDVDSPDINIHNYHEGVLNEAADNGTWIHEFVEATLLDSLDEPTPQNELHEQMAEAFLLWLIDNDVKAEHMEHTVFGDGYAGTFDWIGTVNGTRFLVDNKSSRAVRESHIAQLGALGAAHTMAVEVPEGTEGGVSHTKTIDGKKETRWFIADVLPAFEKYAVLQIRPDDVNSKGEFIPAFCELHEISHDKIAAGYEMFRGALTIKHAERKLKLLSKEEGV